MWQFLLDLRNTLVAEIGYILLLFIPPDAVVFTSLTRHKKEKSEAEVPFDEIRRRLAGEIGRLEVERLTDRIDPWLMTLVVTPVLLAISMALSKQSMTGTILVFLFCATASALVSTKAGAAC